MTKITSFRAGHVGLVGAGPGHLGLLTEEARRQLMTAEVVVFDRLANPSFLEFAPPSAERIDVGKAPGQHSHSQEEINQLLVQLCRQGKRVVRLKGGDPLIFGRGGEEAIALRNAGCSFSITPGLTAAIAAGAYAGIPLTHRGVASTVSFITGHEDPEKDASSINYKALAGVDTLVFYMGIGHLAEICTRLISAGRPASTPAALVERASQPQQRVIQGDLASLPTLAREHHVTPPALIIVGDVVALRKQVDWRNDLTLNGKTVIVTRPIAQAGTLAELLVDMGARVIEAPSIEIHSADAVAGIDDVLHAKGPSDWWVFTSANGVENVLSRLLANGRDMRCLAGTKIAAIGIATADALAKYTLTPDLVPAAFTTQSLAAALVGEGIDGRSVRLWRADLADDVLARTLQEAGAFVESVVAYHIRTPDALPAEAIDALRNGQVDWVTATSAATARNWVSLAMAAGVGDALRGVRMASIGPVTTQALLDMGYPPAVTAEPCTIKALAEAIGAFEAAEN